MPDPRLSARLHRKARASSWDVSVDTFGRALDASAAKAFAGQDPAPRAIERYLTGLHLEDLALACACADGHDAAWEHFILQFRPQLYRAADALDPTGASRDLADSLYGDLFGLQSGTGGRQSMFRYFHGRSGLATWLRAVLAQRYVDRIRANRKTDPLPDDDSLGSRVATATLPDPARRDAVAWMKAALTYALAQLTANDRLRLACYYARQMTLAQIGPLLDEHESTVSRQLARTRREVRRLVEERLAAQHLSEAQIADCFRSVAEDAGPLDLGELLGATTAEPIKEIGLDRSTERQT
jgi:RNA polymerase sigma factor (sigma-70 family)